MSRSCFVVPRVDFHRLPLATLRVSTVVSSRIRTGISISCTCKGGEEEKKKNETRKEKGKKPRRVEKADVFDFPLADRYRSLSKTILLSSRWTESSSSRVVASSNEAIRRLFFSLSGIKTRN